MRFVLTVLSLTFVVALAGCTADEPAQDRGQLDRAYHGRHRAIGVPRVDVMPGRNPEIETAGRDLQTPQEGRQIASRRAAELARLQARLRRRELDVTKSQSGEPVEGHPR